jgi:hypothetical protein
LNKLVSLDQFVIVVPLYEKPLYHRLDWITRILPSVPSCVREIHFRIIAEYDDPDEPGIWQWETIDWSNIDETITSTHFPELTATSVSFVYFILNLKGHSSDRRFPESWERFLPHQSWMPQSENGR